MQLCGSLSILWHSLSLGLEWKLTFSSPVATADFSRFADVLSAAVSQHHLSGFEKLKWGSITSTRFVRKENSSAACKRIQPDYFLTLHTKIKWIKDLHVNLKLKVLEENVGSAFLLRKRKHLRWTCSTDKNLTRGTRTSEARGKKDNVYLWNMK